MEHIDKVITAVAVAVLCALALNAKTFETKVTRMLWLIVILLCVIADTVRK